MAPLFALSPNGNYYLWLSNETTMAHHFQSPLNRITGSVDFITNNHSELHYACFTLFIVYFSVGIELFSQWFDVVDRIYVNWMLSTGASFLS